MKKLAFISLAAIMTSLAASADTIVTSKTYVDTKDNLKQNAITAGTAGSIVTYIGTTTENGGANLGEVAVHSANTYTAGTDDNKIPTMGAVMAQIQSSAVTLPTGTANTVVLYDANGAIGAERAIATTLGTDTTATTLPTTGAVVTGLNGKQATIPATGTNSATAGDTVVTYTSTAGTIGERGIYSDASQYTVGTDANKLVTASALNTVQNAVTALEGCTHTCASSDGTAVCDLITINCVNTGS